MNVTRRARLLNHRALRDTTILNSPFSILNLFYKIKSSCPRFLLGQERIRSCGTTQIDANCVHSAHTSNNARSPDNGRSPRLATQAHGPFAVPSEVHSRPRPLPRSHHPRLSVRFRTWRYFSSSSVSCLNFDAIIAVRPALVKKNFQAAAMPRAEPGPFSRTDSA